MAQGKTKVKAKVPKMIAKKQKQKGKGKAFTQRSSKFFFVVVFFFGYFLLGIYCAVP